MQAILASCAIGVSHPRPHTQTQAEEGCAVALGVDFGFPTISTLDERSSARTEFEVRRGKGGANDRRADHVARSRGQAPTVASRHFVYIAPMLWHCGRKWEEKLTICRRVSSRRSRLTDQHWPAIGSTFPAASLIFRSRTEDVVTVQHIITFSIQHCHRRDV